MKKFLTGIVVLFVVLGCTSGVQAYSYLLDIQSGSLNLTIGKGYESLTLTTPDPLVIGYDAYPVLDSTMNYDYSAVADLDLTYSVPSFGLTGTTSFADSMGLGIFQGIDLDEFIVPGGSITYDDSFLVSGEYDGYVLTDALLSYQVTITSDLTTNTLTLNIIDLTLSGGNASDFLAGLIPGITTELLGMDPSFLISLTDVSMALTPGGTLDLAATPVPVPTAVWLLASGLAGLVGLKRHRA